jgi:hypothetical protein
MRDSETPVQPNRAKRKATVSVGESGGVVEEEVKKVEGMRERMCWMGGEG